MQINQMFERNINRYINGVISVGEEETIKQELEEYVVTKELQRHFSDFFEAYEKGLENPQRNTGVWIQGYFGSGKSHFLKMLSYILQNKTVDGIKAVDYFNGKFDDEMTYARICRASSITAETILFNIDEKGGGYKEGETAETAVLRSIARVFYEHLGFYGRDYKLARFEKMIDDKGRTNEFRAAYEEITGTPWVEDRESYDMFGEEVAEAANRAVGLSIQSITDWADSTESVTVDFAELVDDIAEYAEKRERECGGNFRLLFMVDEMGQYLNGDVSRMLNLQTLVEQFCDKCGGRVWMVVTSQEAIDEMMTVVSMDFSKIQGRFATRLSLSSSSVDEVIKKRVLRKNHNAELLLQDEYQNKSAVLKNLFSFENSRGDLKGYVNKEDYVESFPFVGYQFTIMPSVLKEIRKHGYQGKSLSTGERSMLSSYQEAAQAIEKHDESELVPFWRFFDTLEKELDHGIKQVFERCRRAADNDYTIQAQDVNVLKVLYLINYINDIKPTVANIAVLMVDCAEVDMKSLKESVKDSLDRLVRQNYVARNGECYTFLTDEEQDVAREIRDVQVDPSSVIEEVKKIVFDKIFTDKKLRKGVNDFPVDRYVDNTIHGSKQGGMRLNVITVASVDLADASDAELNLKSSGQALLVLDTASDYYDVLYNAAQINKYVRTQNVSALPKTKRDIIQGKQEEATANRKEAEALISEAIVKGRASVDGRTIQPSAVNAKQKIETILDELASSIFTKADLIDSPIEGDGQLRDILFGKGIQTGIGGSIGGGNSKAADEVERFLDAQARMHLPTTMGDIQRKFQGEPYGWREIDVAAVVARLISEQRVRITYGGAQVDPTDIKMKDYLRKQSEIDKATIKKRTSIPSTITGPARNILRELDSNIDVPSDEDGLVRAVKSSLEERSERYRSLIREKYNSDKLYPGSDLANKAVKIAETVLVQKSDDEAMLRELVNQEDNLLDNAEDLEAVERFFNTNQKDLFDEALETLAKMEDESAYIESHAEVLAAIGKIREIVQLQKPYDRIKEIPALIKEIDGMYEKLLVAQRNETLTKLDFLTQEIEEYAKTEGAAAGANIDAILSDVKTASTSKRLDIQGAETCSKLDSLSVQIDRWRNSELSKIDSATTAIESAATTTTGLTTATAIESDTAAAVNRAATTTKANNTQTKQPAFIPNPTPKPKVKVVSRSSVLPSKTLRSEEEIDEYLAQFKTRLMNELKNNDVIRLG